MVDSSKPRTIRQGHKLMTARSNSHLTNVGGPHSFWPEGKCCAASISVLFSDGLDALAASPDLAERNKSFSVWKYGSARGVERLCRTFENRKLAASWFVPATLIQTHQTLLRDISAIGHDFASHGLTIERYDLFSPQQSLDRVRQSKSLLETCLGQEIDPGRQCRGVRDARHCGDRSGASLQHHDERLAHLPCGWSNPCVQSVLGIYVP